MTTRNLGHAFAALCAAAALWLPGLTSTPAAWAQGAEATAAIGKVLTVTGSATVEHTSAVVVQAKLSSGGPDQAKPGDLVYRGDLLKTGPDGTIGVVFGDGTSFNVSSNASMTLNEFVYDPKGKSNSTLFSLEKGTFTFLAGNIAKSGNMRIDTPVGTMGIRGTAPHVEIQNDGTVKFTTLVEENKKNGQSNFTPPPQKRTEKLTSPDAAAERAERELNRKLNICRGC